MGIIQHYINQHQHFSLIYSATWTANSTFKLCKEKYSNWFSFRRPPLLTSVPWSLIAPFRKTSPNIKHAAFALNFQEDCCNISVQGTAAAELGARFPSSFQHQRKRRKRGEKGKMTYTSARRRYSTKTWKVSNLGSNWERPGVGTLRTRREFNAN